MGWISKPLSVSVMVAATVAATAIAGETTTYTYDVLGRLSSSSIAGGPNDTRATGTCFDAAGNRQRYDVATGSIAACSTFTPTPTPTPPTNQPPVAVADQYSLPCHTDGSKNLTQNDSDPENNLPLLLQSITRTSGDADAAVTSASTVLVSAFGKGPSTFNYVVADSLGATSMGSLQVTATGTVAVCNSGTNALPGNDTPGADPSGGDVPGGAS